MKTKLDEEILRKNGYKEFVELVAEMRSKQKEYFRTRKNPNIDSREILQESKRLEREVDKAIVAILNSQNDIGTLF